MACAMHYSLPLAAHEDTCIPPLRSVAWLGALLVSACGIFAQNISSNAPATRAAEIYQHAHEHYQATPASNEVVLTLARACFDWAEFATNKSQRAELAREGIEASRTLLARSSNSVCGHFYLGMNLGQLARTKSLGALSIVDDMEAEFKAARTLDELFDHAGPDRNLGLLYLQAPSIASIGSRSKARTHLKRALELDPDFPENRLNWIEACVHWKDIKTARQELATLEAALDQVRQKLAGPAWEAAWADWNLRLEKIRGELHSSTNTAHPANTRSGGNR